MASLQTFGETKEPVLEWSHQQATETVKQLLGLSDDKTVAVETAVRQATDKHDNGLAEPAQMEFVSQSLRENGTISDRKFELATVRFYFEVQGIDSHILPPFSGTGREFLERLYDKGIVHIRASALAEWFFVAQSCTTATSDLLMDNGFMMSAALRAGLASNHFSRADAQKIEFCVITGLGPLDAEAYGANEDLCNAVERYLATQSRGRAGADHRTTIRVQACLFPFVHDQPWTIKHELGIDLDDFDDVDYIKPRRDYLVKYFKESENCDDDARAQRFLEANDWSMEKATSAHRAIVLAPAMPTQDNTDKDLHSTLLDLVSRYTNSKPTETIVEHHINALIRAFENGSLRDPENIGPLTLHAHLTYRISKCNLALEIAKQLGLYNCAITPVDSWDPHQVLPMECRDRMGATTALLKRHTTWFKAGPGQGYPSYEKPFWYLSWGMYLHGKEDPQPDEEVMAMIERARGMMGEEVAGASMP